MKLDLTLLSPGKPLLVALSGGVDSLALLHALRAIRPEWRLRLCAAHVHHGMRGEEADTDVAYLEQLCTAWDVPLFVERADVPALARQRGLGIEEAGRHARYAAFARICEAEGIATVATAHHADDQAETVLLNLFRGCGMDGLAGIPRRRRLLPDHDWEVVRPLLDVRRPEIENYCRVHRLTPLFDRTNDDPHFLRNRVRQKLLPLLEALDPAVRRHLLRLSAQVCDELELLESTAESLLRAAERQAPPTWVRGGVTASGPCLDANTLAAASPAAGRRALRHFLRALGEGVEIEEPLVDRVLALIRGKETAVELPGVSVRLRRRGRLVQPEALRQDVPVPEPLTFHPDGITQAAEFDLILESQTIPGPVGGRQPPDRVLLDAASLTLPLILRTPRRGDRFRPLGAPGSRLLSDVLSERGVPAIERPYWPLVCDQSGIVWVVGHIIADRVKVTASSRFGLEITAAMFHAVE